MNSKKKPLKNLKNIQILCCSNRSRSNLYVRCCAVLRVTAFSVSYVIYGSFYTIKVVQHCYQIQVYMCTLTKIAHP